MDELIFDEKKHEYQFNGKVIPSITQTLTEAGIIDTTWMTDGGRERGKAVHAALHYLDEGDLDEATVDPQLWGYIQGWIAFVKDTGFKSEGIEEIIYNPIYSYAGRYDRIGVLEKSRRSCIIEIKTGKPHPATALQLAGQLACLFNKNRERIAVQLCEDGKYKVHKYDYDKDVDIFYGAVMLVHWKRTYGLGGMKWQQT